MGSKIFKVTIALLIVLFSCMAYGEEENEFPWLMDSYKYGHLTPEQKKIYLNAYFETIGFIIYNYAPREDSSSMKQLNAWINCVMATKDSEKWSPNLSWLFGENLKKSAAYIFYNKISSIICKGYTEKAGAQLKILKIYSYDNWRKFSLKDKAVYLAGYIDTVASFQMRLKDTGVKNDLRDLQILIEATGIDGILSDVVGMQFEGKDALPWPIARGLGVARKRIFQD